jgi:outer membrane protein assembly factor BamE (lipoprotein component of BamABCDE complex)
MSKCQILLTKAINCLFIFIITIGVLTISGCSKNLKQKGYNFNQVDFQSLSVNKSSKEDVLNILGSPSTASEFGDQTWFYISSKKESFAFMKPKLIEQKIIAIHFDNNNMIDNIENYQLDQAKIVEFSNDFTPTGGDDDRLVKKLFGNIGKFNKNSNKNRKVTNSRS